MNSLINANFSRTYNPKVRKNVLSDIKRLLTSRDTESQSKACGYLIETINKYNCNSNERKVLVEYLLDSDITVFLCEATSNLDFSLFRSILLCIRLLWQVRRFFEEEHATHALSTVIRTLVHYTAVDAFNAVEGCLHFICDLLNGIKSYEITSPLSLQSAYNIEQLLASLMTLATRVHNKSKTILCSAFVLHALVSYQPPGINLKGNVAMLLVEVLNKWFEILMGGLNRIVIVGENEDLGSALLLTCQLGIDSLRLATILQKTEKPTDLVHQILTDEQEIKTLQESALKIKNTIHTLAKELVVFTKDYQGVINTDEYRTFLKFIHSYMNENAKSEVLGEFGDILFSKGYLSMLPQANIIRNDVTVRKVSILVLGQLLKVLTEKYLVVEARSNIEICINDIEMDLIDLQYGIEKFQYIGPLLQNKHPYSLLIYIYFYCQSPENTGESTSPLLPYLVEYILHLPKSIKPPGYIIKALWLVFAMSTVSNASLESLDKRVYLEKATDSLVILLHPEPSLYYTHNPAILLWSFTSSRIPNYVRLQVLSEWLKIETSLPSILIRDSTLLWELLLNIIIQSKDNTITTNCMEALNVCVNETDDNSRDEIAVLIWSILPSVLSKALIDNDENLAEINISYLLDIAIKELPIDLDQNVCAQVAVLITSLYSKNVPDSNVESRYHFEFVCLKLCLLLLGVSRSQDDNKVLLTYTNRPGFLPSVLAATNSADDRVACAALELLSYIVYYFAKNKYQPKSIVEVKTDLIVKSLRRENENERGSYLLQLVYMVLNSSINTPLVLSYESDYMNGSQQCNVLRALMFRIQFMLCCRDATTQVSAGWKTLSSIFKHAIAFKNDSNLVATLTAQPWTHTLIRFQLTHTISPEFLSFVQNWLTFLKITLKKSRETIKINISKHSLVMMSLKMLKNNLVDENLKNPCQNVIFIVNDILDECNNRG